MDSSWHGLEYAAREAQRDTRILRQESREGSDSKDGAGARLGSRRRNYGRERALTRQAIEVGRKCESDRLNGPGLRFGRYRTTLR